MKHKDWPSVYLDQYRLVPKLLSGVYDPDTAFEVLNHLLDRDEMEKAPELVGVLESADDELRDALVNADDEWWRNLDRWAAECGYVSSLWWMTTRYEAQRRRGSETSLVDTLRYKADSWVVFGNDDDKPIEALSAPTIVVNGFSEALRVGLAQIEHYIPPQAGQGHSIIPSELQKFARASISVVVPSSLSIGMQLPLQSPGEPADGPARQSLAAAALVMEASSRYDPAGDPDSLADLVDITSNRDRLWRALGRIQGAGGEDTDTVRLHSAILDGESDVVWQVEKKPRKAPRARQQRETTVDGELRAVDLDKMVLRLRAPGAKRATTVIVPPSLFIPVDQLGLHLGKPVCVTGYTRDQTEPPGEITASHFD